MGNHRPGTVLEVSSLAELQPELIPQHHKLLQFHVAKTFMQLGNGTVFERHPGRHHAVPELVVRQGTMQELLTAADQPGQAVRQPGLQAPLQGFIQSRHRPVGHALAELHH